MAVQQNASSKSKSQPAAETPVVAETISETAPAPVKAPEPALATTTPQVAQEATTEAFDAAFWPKKSFDLWAENVTAFFDFAERLGKAKNFDEVTSLHARFVTERLESAARHSTEWLTQAQRLASLSTAPLCGARAA